MTLNHTCSGIDSCQTSAPTASPTNAPTAVTISPTTVTISPTTSPIIKIDTDSNNMKFINFSVLFSLLLFVLIN